MKKKVTKKTAKPAKKPAAKPAVKATVKSSAKTTAKPAAKATVKPSAKPAAKPAVTTAVKPIVTTSKSSRRKFTLEYIIRSSPAILFEFLTQATNLSQWFSEYCDSQEDIFIFGWGGQDFQRARQVDLVEEDSVKYHWEHSTTGEYFAFKVYKSEIANDTILEVTDFADPKDVKEQTLLWDKQIDNLKHAIGAF